MGVWGVARRLGHAGEEVVAAELAKLCEALGVERAALWWRENDEGRPVLAATVGPEPLPEPAGGIPLEVEGREVALLAVPAESRARCVPATGGGVADDHVGRLLQGAAMAIERARLLDAERRFRLGAEHARRHLALLAEAGAVLGAPHEDPDAALAAVVDVMVPAFADWCAVDVPDGATVRRLTWRAGAQAASVPVDALHDAHPAWPRPALRTIASGQSELMAALGTGTGFLAEDADHIAISRALGLDSCLLAPIRLRGLTVGVVTCGTAPTRRGFRPSDVKAAEEVASRVAAAVERALLYRESQQRAERASVNEARLRALVDASPMAIVELAPDGTVEQANAAARRMFAWPEGAGDWRLPAMERDGYAVDHREFVGPSASSETEVVLRSADGAVALSVATAPLRWSGATPEGTLVVLADVTERKRLEEQEAITRRMEAVGRTAGGVAHDLNNLLTVVLGHSQLLLRVMSAEDSGRESVEAIRMAGERAANLSSQLLTISRGHLVQPELVDVRAAVTSIEPVLRRLLPPDIQLELRIGQDVGPVLLGRGHLEQVLLNLVVNARDAMTAGGRITVTVSGNGDTVTLVVADSGEGMESHLLEHCFEPFVTTKQRPGSGLGLATVYGIVTQGGGDVSAASERGKGTAFTLRLPRASGRPEAAPRARRHVVAGGRERVLLVEDDPAVRSLAQQILENDGYRVTDASSGREALDIVGRWETDFDLIVTDVAMPDMDGVQLVARLAEGGTAPPTLYVSGYVDDAVGTPESLPRGAEFLAKPFSPAALSAKVRQVLDQPVTARRSTPPRERS